MNIFYIVVINVIENKPEETNGDEVFERCPKPRKRRWGSSSSSKFNKRKQIINISTESLKVRHFQILLIFCYILFLLVLYISSFLLVKMSYKVLHR